MFFSIKNLGNVVPALRETFLRFPLPVICSIAATLLALLLIHDVELAARSFIVRCVASLVYGTVALTSLKLLAESKRWSLIRYLVASVVVAVIVVAYVWGIYVESAISTYIYFSLAVGLSLLFAPYIKRSSRADSVWYFNYQNAVAVFFGGLAAVILGMGLSLILLSIRYLFEIKIASEAFADVWALSWGVLFPLYILANVAKKFDYENEGCGFPKGVSFIANYILVPLMLAYMLILYAYFLKIVLQWELPRGNLGWMIIAFGTIGIVTKLLAYPIRNEGTRFLRLFDHYYYYALIVPILLLALAIGVRINDYGVTEQRYGVVLLGTWFAAVVLLTFVKRDRFHIKHVPMLLTLLAILASFGPWSATNVSLHSQLSRFEALLSKHRLLENGQAVRVSGDIPFEDRKTLSSIADYLGKMEYRRQHIEPLFKTLMDEADTKEDHDSKMHGSQFIALLGIEYVNRWQVEKDVSAFNYQLNSYSENVMLDVAGFDYVGRGNFYLYGKNAVIPGKTFTLYANNGHQKLTVKFDGKLFEVATVSGDNAGFDLAGHIKTLRAQDVLTFKDAERNRMELAADSAAGEFTARLLLEHVSGKVTQEDAMDIGNLKYALMLKFNR